MTYIAVTVGKKIASVTLFLIALMAAGQSAPSQSNALPDAPRPAQKTDRIFGLISGDIVVEPGADTAPITAKQKFKYTSAYFSPYTLLFVGARAGISQAQDSERLYGQGGEGFGKRFGAAAADGFTSTFLTNSVLPTVFHQDPRYFRKGSGGFGSRLSYAISRVVVGRTDSGHPTYNFPIAMGSLASAAIGNAYYPRNEREASDVFSRAGIQVGYLSLFNILYEFYPDVQRNFHRHH